MTHRFYNLQMPVASILMNQDVFQMLTVSPLTTPTEFTWVTSESYGSAALFFLINFHLIVVSLLKNYFKLLFTVVYCTWFEKNSPVFSVTIVIDSDTLIMVCYSLADKTSLFLERDISITHAQCLSPHMVPNWQKTISCKRKGAYPLLVIRRWSWHKWWKSLYKYMRLETLGERCHVENSWDTHPAITNVFPVHPSCMYVNRL